MLSLQGFAQSKKALEKRAAHFSEVAATKMQLNEEQAKLVYDSFLEKLMYFNEQINGNDLSQEEKQKVYSTGYKNMVKRLKPTFTQEEINRMQAIFDEEKKKENK